MSESPYELQRLITVATFSTPWEAQIAKARLAADGLHALIADEHVIRMVALSNAIGGIQLKVREQDAAGAVEVLRHLAPLPEIYLVGGAAAVAPRLGEPPAALPAPGAGAGGVAGAGGAAGAGGEAGAREAAAGHPGGWRCPACGGGDLQLARSTRRLLGVLPVSRRALRCGDCGVLWKADEIERAAMSGGAGTPDTSAAGAPERAAGGASGGRMQASGIPASGASGEPGDWQLATIARFHTPWEAQLAGTLLESEGVRCCILEERLPAVNLLSAEPKAFNRLEVHPADAERAVEILARAWSAPQLAAAPDPDSGSGLEPEPGEQD